MIPRAFIWSVLPIRSGSRGKIRADKSGIRYVSYPRFCLNEVISDDRLFV